MNLALTLVIQGVVFFLVAWAVMKFFWPYIMNAIETRLSHRAARWWRAQPRAISAANLSNSSA